MAESVTGQSATMIRVSRLRTPLTVNGTASGGTRRPRPNPPVCPFCGRAMRRAYYRRGDLGITVSLIVDYGARGKYGYWFCVGEEGGKMHPIHVAQTPET